MNNTVDDYLINIKNRFKLTLIATKRVRNLLKNRKNNVNKKGKVTTIVLKEFVKGYIFDNNGNIISKNKE